MPATILHQSPASDPDEQRLALPGVEWDQYEQIAELLIGRHIRLSYSRGVLEFATISPKHGWLARLIGRLVVVLSEEVGMTRRSCGDITMKRPDIERGIEPDLGIEVDITASSRRRMPIYAALGIPEIWRFSRDQLVIHRRQEDGTYAVAAHSAYFPFVTGAALTEFLSRRNETDENTLMQSFRDWARQQIAAV